MVCSPILLGCSGLVLSAAYQAQRYGVFLHSFYALDRFIQYHLDGIAGWASLCGFVGLLVGTVILRFQSARSAATIGIIISTAALLWSMLFLSL